MIEVPSKGLAELLSSVGNQRHIDILQVDAEGMDDAVIYHSDIDLLKPKVIAFEAKHLSLDQLTKLEVFLAQRGYRVGYHGREGLEMNTSASPLPTSQDAA